MGKKKVSLNLLEIPTGGAEGSLIRGVGGACGRGLWAGPVGGAWGWRKDGFRSEAASYALTFRLTDSYASS